MLREIPDGRYEGLEELEDDGLSDQALQLRLAIEVKGDTAHFDFTGTAPAYPDPLNANQTIVVSSIFYALRVLAMAEIPANSGSLRPLSVTIPKGSLLDPPESSAVAGGNVETSQRLVDLVFATLEVGLPGTVYSF